MKITLYTLPSCPRCSVLKAKLQELKDYEVDIIEDKTILKQLNIEEVPVLEFAGEKYNFVRSLEIIKELKDNANQC